VTVRDSGKDCEVLVVSCHAWTGACDAPGHCMLDISVCVSVRYEYYLPMVVILALL